MLIAVTGGTLAIQAIIENKTGQICPQKKKELTEASTDKRQDPSTGIEPVNFAYLDKIANTSNLATGRCLTTWPTWENVAA